MSVPAAEVERFVVDQLRGIGSDPAVVAATVAKAREQQDRQQHDLRAEAKRLVREQARLAADVQRLAGLPDRTSDLADVQERLRRNEQRHAEVQGELAEVEQQRVDERDVAAALAAFGPAWDALVPREQARLVALLVERVVYDGARGTVAVTFRPAGIRCLSAEQQQQHEQQEVAA
jgi:site-specific DNA recombinase